MTTKTITTRDELDALPFGARLLLHPDAKSVLRKVDADGRTVYEWESPRLQGIDPSAHMTVALKAGWLTWTNAPGVRYEFPAELCYPGPAEDEDDRCDHPSLSGVDQTPLEDERKVWRCDGCDALFRGGRELPTVDGHRARVRQLYGGTWRVSCYGYGCDVQVYAGDWRAAVRLAQAHVYDAAPRMLITPDDVAPSPFVELAYRAAFGRPR